MNKPLTINIPEGFSRWDSAAHLTTEEDVQLYLDACFEEAGDDHAFIAKALGVVARARGMMQLSKDTGLARESLYRALSGTGNPEFSTILKVTNALGLRLQCKSVAKKISTRQPATRRTQSARGGLTRA